LHDSEIPQTLVRIFVKMHETIIALQGPTHWFDPNWCIARLA